jgi:hypothetical protein
VSVRKRLGIEDYNDMSESLLKLQVRMYDKKQRKKKRTIRGKAGTIKEE